jgi:hypothetical protein
MYDDFPDESRLAGGSRNFDYGKHEGKHVKRHLKQLNYHSKMMHEMLKDSDDLPDWVNAKVTLAADYIDSVSHYMKNRVEEMNYGKKSTKINRRTHHRLNKKHKKTMKK